MGESQHGPPRRKTRAHDAGRARRASQEDAPFASGCCPGIPACASFLQTSREGFQRTPSLVVGLTTTSRRLLEVLPAAVTAAQSCAALCACAANFTPPPPPVLNQLRATD